MAETVSAGARISGGGRCARGHGLTVIPPSIFVACVWGRGSFRCYSSVAEIDGDWGPSPLVTQSQDHQHGGASQRRVSDRDADRLPTNAAPLLLCVTTELSTRALKTRWCTGRENTSCRRSSLSPRHQATGIKGKILPAGRASAVREYGAANNIGAVCRDRRNCHSRRKRSRPDRRRKNTRRKPASTHGTLNTHSTRTA